MAIRRSIDTEGDLAPEVIPRKRDEVLEQRALAAGLAPVAARILASRGLDQGLDIEAFLRGGLEVIEAPSLLVDMEAAGQRVAAAVMSGETIGIQTDYDVDGLGGHAMLYTVLTEMFGHPRDKVVSVVGNRLTEGYGLTKPVAERILAARPAPTVVITADNGSSDEDRIALLKAANMDVIVTDHHLVPLSGPPASAFACINPQRQDCSYPDKAIAGGMVAWLLMARTRRELIECGYLDPQHQPGLADVLDYVACSTVADCVSLGSSLANRAVVRHGLRLIEAQKRTCWTALSGTFGEGGVSAETIAFQIGPRINSRTRIDDPMAALHFLLADSSSIAMHWADKLEKSNEARKAIERGILEDAERLARLEVEAGKAAVTLLLEDAHPGVQGICASRIVERFGRPALLFSPNVDDKEMITGSARGIEGYHCRDALEAVGKMHAGILKSFGGHKAAAGVRLKRADFPKFQQALEMVARDMLQGELLGPRVLTDGELPAESLSLKTIDELKVLEPFGRGFEAPIFEGRFKVLAVRTMGDGTHLKLKLQLGNGVFEAVWFRALKKAGDPLPVEAQQARRLVYELKENCFRGTRRAQLMVRASA